MRVHARDVSTCGLGRVSHPSGVTDHIWRSAKDKKIKTTGFTRTWDILRSGRMEMSWPISVIQNLQSNDGSHNKQEMCTHPHVVYGLHNIWVYTLVRGRVRVVIGGMSIHPLRSLRGDGVHPEVCTPSPSQRLIRTMWSWVYTQVKYTSHPRVNPVRES